VFSFSFSIVSVYFLILEHFKALKEGKDQFISALIIRNVMGTLRSVLVVI
jgi:hypothetical protein